MHVPSTYNWVRGPSCILHFFGLDITGLCRSVMLRISTISVLLMIAWDLLIMIIHSFTCPYGHWPVRLWLLAWHEVIICEVSQVVPHLMIAQGVIDAIA